MCLAGLGLMPIDPMGKSVAIAAGIPADYITPAFALLGQVQIKIIAYSRGEIAKLTHMPALRILRFLKFSGILGVWGVFGEGAHTLNSHVHATQR